jgi:dTDP-4-dehydrorhamnose 3,5-epimerase
LKFTETSLPGACLIEQQRHSDARGYFARTFCAREFGEHGLSTQMVQGNVSYNAVRGTLRGMHMQRAPHGEDKLVSCIAGALYDVIVDVRPESAAYGRWLGVELRAGDGRALYVPKGFAHGFITLEDHTVASYLMSEFYAPGFAAGFRHDDAAVGIVWPLPVAVISEQDARLPGFVLHDPG